MPISRAELIEFFALPSPLRHSIQKLGAQALQRRVGATGLAVGPMYKATMPVQYEHRGTPLTEGFVTRVAEYARFMRRGKPAHADIIISSRIAAGDEDPDTRWLPIPAQLRAHAVIADNHPETIGGSAICPEPGRLLLTLFRLRQGAEPKPAPLIRLRDDATPTQVRHAMSRARLAHTQLEFDIPSMMPFPNTHHLGHQLDELFK